MKDELLEEHVSQEGRRVIVLRACNGYEGGQPFFIVGYCTKEGDRQVTRYTPHRERVNQLVAVFKQDITDPARLAHGPISPEAHALVRS